MSHICALLTVVFGIENVKLSIASSGSTTGFADPIRNVSVRFAPLIVRGKLSL